MNTSQPTRYQRARSLRKHMTDAERLLWRHLRDRRLGGWKFRRQHPVGPFIVDFICSANNLIVEIDGGQHAVNVQKDAERTAYLIRQGYRLVRFWNTEVLNELDSVLEVILRELSQ